MGENLSIPEGLLDMQITGKAVTCPVLSAVGRVLVQHRFEGFVELLNDAIGLGMVGCVFIWP